MCHKMKEILKLIKEFVAIMNSEKTRAAIEAYRELQELWKAADDDGGMSAAEEDAALEKLTTIVEDQEQLGKE